MKNITRKKDKEVNKDNNEMSKEVESKKTNEAKKTVNERKSNVRVKVLKFLVNNSLIIGLVLGLIAILFSVFTEIFFPLLLFIILLSLINVIFVKKTIEEEFRFLLSIAGLIIILVNFLQYLPAILQLLELSNTIVPLIAPSIGNVSILVIVVTIIPAFKSIFKLVFLHNK